MFRNRIIEYGVKPADQFLANPKNARLHPQIQREVMKSALETVGFVAPVVESKSGYLLDGHERIFQALQNNNADVPFVVVDVDEDEEDYILLTFDPITSLATYDTQKLDDLLREVNTDSPALQKMLGDLANEAGLYKLDFGVDKNAKPNPRKLPLDVIYTLQMADCTCCLAVQAGLKYGIQSAHYRICPYTYELSGRHEVSFIDNDYFNYDHATHLKAVKELKPKYATVRDVMTKEQCGAVGIQYYSLGQILKWAYELAEYAENVIVIPKWDCLDDIPDEFMLGYSVPTSHGGTPLPPEIFKGRRVHLLGGSWKAQLAHMAILADSVVSLDTNYVQRQARMLGAACTPDGDEFQMQERGFDYLTNVRYAALALSFGAIGAKVNELYALSPPLPSFPIRLLRTRTTKTGVNPNVNYGAAFNHSRVCGVCGRADDCRCN